jgi:hypothetical protein
MDPATEGAEIRERAGQNLSHTTIGRCLYSGTGEAAEDGRRAGQNGVDPTLGRRLYSGAGEAAEDGRRAGQNGVDPTLVGAQLDYANAERRRT